MEISKVSKAIAGALITMLVAYLAKHGFTLDPVVSDALQVIVTAFVTAVVGYVAVYWAPKNKV